MRLIHIVGDSKFGGASIIMLELSLRAAQDGYKVDILTTDRIFCERAQRLGIGVVSIDVIRREIRPLWDIIGLIKLVIFLRKSKYDIVHTHTSKAGFVGRLAAYIAGVPVIIHTVHGFSFHEGSSKITVHFYSMLERLAACACDYIVFVSDYHRRQASLLNIGIERKHVVILNGVDEGRLIASHNREDIARDFGIDSSVPWIVTVGRLVAQKGLVYLFEAALVLKQRGLKFKILIVGDGPVYKKLVSFTRRNGLLDVVTFTGFQNDVASFISSADMVAIPTLREGLSIVLLEAMALKKPIVTTSILSNLEVVEDGISGITVPPKEPVALAEMLDNLIRNEGLRERLGAGAYERYREHFTSEKMLDEYIKLYNLAERSRMHRVTLGSE